MKTVKVDYLIRNFKSDWKNIAQVNSYCVNLKITEYTQYEMLILYFVEKEAAAFEM